VAPSLHEFQYGHEDFSGFSNWQVTRRRLPFSTPYAVLVKIYDSGCRSPREHCSLPIIPHPRLGLPRLASQENSFNHGTTTQLAKTGSVARNLLPRLQRSVPLALPLLTLACRCLLTTVGVPSRSSPAIPHTPARCLHSPQRLDCR
jgi:hypothetical protein